LLLDEPTNHLDMESVDALASALQAFEGGVVLCTHDRHLIASVAKEILLVKDGRADIFKGSPEDYLAQLEKK